MHLDSRFRRRSVAAFALVACLVVAPAALAKSEPFHVSVTGYEFTDFTCLNDSCSLASVTVTGKATGNLATGTGTYQAAVVLDFSPGGTCNIADESIVFSFADGTVLAHSHHEDCAIHGLRVDAPFEITGGTGDFAGATGGGREHTSAAAPPAIIYDGTISF
jgi:hypothetical protein